MPKYNKIVIVGGGTAGAMSAVTLKHYFPQKEIILIEDKNTPSVGVGESTLGSIRNWLSLLNIQDKDFMKECNATYKLAIKFTGFNKKNEGSFFYPFGNPNVEDNQADLNDWCFKKILYPETSNTDYANSFYPSMSLLNNNKLCYNIDNWVLTRDSAFHFDALAFAAWLKKMFVDKLKGITMTGKVQEVGYKENGDIEYLHTETEKIYADLFIDCTGFKSLLLGGALKEPFNSYEDILPNNSAWATKVPYKDKQKELVAYTDCTAIDNGWVWNIPLWDRIGTGYVYSDKFISDEDALKQFKEHINNDEIEAKNIKMKIGLYERIWVKNVCAIGFAAGFIEPLESNGLYTVHQFLVKLLRVLQKESVSRYAIDHFNESCKKQFRSFSEFVSLHYALTEREDTEYWKQLHNKEYPLQLDYLQNYKGFQDYITCKMDNFHYPKEGGFHCIATGMNWYPTELVSIRHGLQIYETDMLKTLWKGALDNLEEKKKRWNLTAQTKDSYIDYLNKSIYKA
jgi:flavin-dependent dehydrogenase